jgi:predicted transcriptional regulator
MQKALQRVYPLTSPVELENPVVLSARKRVLFHILKHGRKYRANISQVARDMNASDGNVNQYVNDLKAAGLLKVVQKGGVEYFRVTWKGQVSLTPVILPRFVTLFVMVVGLTQVLWAEIYLVNRAWVPTPTLLLTSGSIITGFALVLYWAENRMDYFLLEPKSVSSKQKASSTEKS